MSLKGPIIRGNKLDIFRPVKRVFAVGDSDFAAVDLLMPFDGVNGSTDFVDESNTARTFTTATGPVLTTTDPKFGTASVNFATAGGSIRDNSGVSGFNYLHTLEEGYTVECWVYANALGTQVILDNGGISNNQTGFTLYLAGASGGITARIANGIGAAVLCNAPAGSYSINNWFHLAFEWIGDQGVLYVNGVQVATGAVGTIGAGNATQSMYIGIAAVTQTFPMNGRIDDLRISKTIRYGASFTPAPSFTPPTEAFPTS